MLGALEILRAAAHLVEPLQECVVPFVEPLACEIGGVCAFGVTRDDVRVYCDESMKRFDTVYPACGSSNSCARFTPDELFEALKAVEPQPIACDTWHPTDNVPDVSVRVAHDGEAILLRYDVCEREIRAACIMDGLPRGLFFRQYVTTRFVNAVEIDFLRAIRPRDGEDLLDAFL